MNKRSVVTQYMDPVQCIGWFGNVQIILSAAPPTQEFMGRIIEGLAGLASRTGKGTGALLVIASSVEPPADEARAYIRRELARSSMLAAAQVVEGSGFRGAAMRAVLSMLQLAVRPNYAMKVFSETSLAAHWLSGELHSRAGLAPHGTELAGAVEEFRASFLAQAVPGKVAIHAG